MGPENGDAAEDLNGLQDDLEEETLSLCDLPDDDGMKEFAVSDDLRRQQPAEFFEFFSSNERRSDMCPADDIIVSGKLLPLKDRPLWRQDPRCRRSESLSELKSETGSSSFKARVVRSSRSLDDRRRSLSHSSLDGNCSGNGDASSSKMSKSRWQLLISGIGMVKFPLEMELRDIKNRQSRRSSQGTMFPGSEEKSSASNGGRGSSWGLIKALSCKGHTSISVTASFTCMPPT